MIRDKAIPVKLGGLKMQKYHGHARLELRDVKTGKVEVEVFCRLFDDSVEYFGYSEVVCQR